MHAYKKFDLSIAVTGDRRCLIKARDWVVGTHDEELTSRAPTGAILEDLLILILEGI